MSVEELIEELSRVLHEADAARLVARRAGVSAAVIGEFKSPLLFWHRVVGEVANGRTEGGVQAIAEAAAAEYSANEVFKRFSVEEQPQADKLDWSDEPPPGPKPFPGHEAEPRLWHHDRPLLTVIATRQGSRVALSYRVDRHAGLIERPPVEWDPDFEAVAQAMREGEGPQLQDLGVRLGSLLLGEDGEDAHHQLMRALFGAEGPSERTTPLAGAARCRLVLDESLEVLPWRLAAMRDRDGTHRWLADEGWTFEHGPKEPSGQNVELPSPCQIMLVVPDSRGLKPAGAVLVERVKSVLESLWPTRRGRIASHLAVVSEHEQVQAELRSRTPPNVVVVFGDVSSAPEPTVVLRGPRRSKRVALASLVDELAEAEVSLLYVAATKPLTLPVVARGRVPCVVLPTLPAPQRAVVMTCVSWLHTMLVEGCDPVTALHRPPAEGPSRHWCALRAHAEFQQWRAKPARAIGVDQLARRRLDRDTPRSVFMRHVDLLVNDSARKVEAFVAHGRPQDRLEWLGDQLEEEYKDRRPEWGMCREQLLFPHRTRGGAASVLDFDAMVKEAVGLEPGMTLSGCVTLLAKESGWPRRPFVYWLDWSARHDGVESGSLEAWMQTSAQVLPKLVQGLDGVSVIASLGVVTNDREYFARVARQYGGEVKKSSPMTSVTVLDALGVVTTDHLDRYLEDERSGCPPKLAQAVSDVIISKTGGDFSEVVRHVEKAERNAAWRMLAAEARDAAPLPELDPNQKI